MATLVDKKVLLIARLKEKALSGKTFELNAGMGDAGQAIRISAEANTTYELQDLTTRRGPNAVRAKRVGRDLEIFLEGSAQPDAIIERYYDEGIITSPSESLTGITPSGNTGVYVIDEGLRPALSSLSFEVTPITLTEAVAVIPSWVGVAAAMGGMSLVMAGQETPMGDLLITGKVVAGPVKSGVKLSAYDQNGQLLGTADIASDGTYRIAAAGKGNYRGTVLLKAIDANDTVPNYLDEATGSNKSLDTELRALGVAQGSSAQFTITGENAHLVINISPLTELAVRQAAVAGNMPVASAVVEQVNANVAKAFGLIDAGTGKPIDITGDIVPTNSAEFNAVDSVSSAEKYGLALAKLSGLDVLNSGNMETSLDLLSGTLSGDTFNATGLKLVDQGRAQALIALKQNSTTFNAGAGDSDTNTTLNRQLLGDIVVRNQVLDGSQRLVVSGIALPKSTVTVTLPDGSTQTAAVDADGNFTLTSIAPQPQLTQSVKVSGSDALAAPVSGAAPNVPVINTTNGKLLTGQGDPGSTVEIFAPGGVSLGRTTVDAFGNWSLTPDTAVATGTVLTATAVDSSGNASGPGAGTSDASAVVMTIPEASDGYINALEKASRGGVPILISLPANAAVGDVVTSVVKLPDGTSFTVSSALTPSQVAVGSVTQLLTSAQLSVDGLYQVSTSVIHGSSTSSASQQSFLLDSHTPAAPTIAPTNGQVIYGNAEPGSIVKVYDSANQLLGTIGPVGADGNWTLIPSTPLANNATVTATATLSATATDPAGNTSVPGTGQISTGTLLITGAVDNVGPNLGLLLDGAMTNDNSPQISGSVGTPLTSGQSLAIYRQLENGEFILVGNATVNGTTWNLQDSGLIDGNYTYQARVMSGSTVVQTSGDFNLTVLTSPPASPSTAVPEANDHLINAAEKLSDNGVPAVTQLPTAARIGDVITTTVTLPNGSPLTLSTTLSQADIQAGFVSQLIPRASLAADGTYPVSTTYTSSITGLTSAPTDNTFTLDTTAPVAGTGALATASDTGILGDNKTNDNTPALSGTAEANATVQIVVNGQSYTTTANAQGVWSLPATAVLPDGTYTPVITVTDAAGNSTTANGTPFIVDTSAPAIPGVHIPDAPRGVNTSEASDGVALVINLPNDAVAGDTLTSVVTKPDGTTLTLTRVLTAADITAGQYVQTVPQAQLLTNGSSTNYLDGAWRTSTTLTDAAGNTSPAQADGFQLSANGPALTLNTVAGDGTVNALEKAGDLPVSGTTTAEAGQAVTVQLLAANGTVIGTYYTIVQPNGSFALNIPQAALPADGSYTLKADVSNFAGTPAVQQTSPVIFDTTAPVISVTSVAGDAVTASSNGTFDGSERGFNLTDYTLSSTVPTPPVISGTTDAQAGQVVNVLFNNISYTTAVQADGTWAITLTQDEAKALVHGNTYAITASVSDLAGNPATPDTNNHMVVNIAPPDVPTVVPQYAGTITPVITGVAQKLNGANAISLAAGDKIDITLNGVKVSATIQASGTATDIAGVTYDPATQTWSLDTAAAASFNLQAVATYNVAVTTTTAGGTLTRSDISAGELVLDTTPPAITLNPISPDASGASVINGFEQGQSVTLTGTTTAQVGSTVTLTGLDGVTRTAIVQAGTNGLNTYSIPVPGTAIDGMADGTYTPQVSVTNLFGLTGTDTEALRLDTTAPSAPFVALPEAPGGINAVEAANGTPLVVTLPADVQAGDTVTTVVTNPDGTTSVLTTVLSASDITSGQITQTIPSNALTVDGPWTTRTTVTDTAGNASAQQTGSFVLDTAAPGAPGVALPEALNGVNAAEALSNGGTPLAVTLPGDELVGDTVTTIVTLPTGSTLTLTHVLTADDITAGAITQLIPTSALTQDGTWTTSTIVTDLTGNASAPRFGSFVLDTILPAAPAASLASVSDSGTLGDSITADTTPSISGTGTPGDTITVTFPGGETQTAVVAADGSWSVTPTTALSDGVNNVSVTASDPAGNVSLPTSLPVTIDTSAPLAPTAALATVSDTGTLGDSLTKDNTPTLSGTGVAGDTITVKDAAGNVIAIAVVNANGQWSATPTTALPDGLNALSVTATDPAGNTGPAVALPITIDTSAPAAPAATLAAASDSGVPGDSITADNTPTISGTGTPGDTITVTFPGGEIQTVVIGGTGTWSLTPTNPLADGLNNVSVTATDPAGNTSPATTVPVTIDTTAPAAPAGDVAAASDTGASNTDNITSDTTPTISGAGATPGDTITLYAPNGTTVLGTAVVAADGSWAITPTTALAEGLSTLSVKATDPAGNTSAATPVPVTIDTTAPAAPTVTAQDTNDSTPVITGTATLGAGETLQVTVNGATYNVTVGLGGLWSLNTSTLAPVSGTLGAFVDGQIYAVTATVTDAAGNATSDATTSELRFDTTTPSVPTVNPVATNDSTPVITGTANLLAGETLTVTVNGATYNVTVASNGTWRLDTGATTPASGTLGVFVNGTSYPVTATITDAANNATSDTSTNELLFDTTAPAAPAGDVATTSDTGSSNTDNITSDTTPDIVGTGTAGDTITLYAPNGTTVLGTAVVDAAGNWSITPTALPQGTSALQITATDPAGNTSAPGTVSVTIDTTALAAPAALLDPASDSGTQGDSITNDNSPTISGTGEPNATITVKDANGNVIATAVVDANGNWSATPTTALPNGLNALSVTATDAAGNVSQPTALPITIDTTAPNAPAAALASSSDTGIVGDAVTADTTPTLTGTGTPGDTITVKDGNGNTIATAVVATDGSWSATPTAALADGLHNLQVIATDPAGNTSAPTTVPVTIDATAPAAPTPDMAAASDTGSSHTDNITSDTTPTIQGTGTAGDTITLYAPNGTTVLGTATVAANGTWAITPTTALPDGTTTLSVTATDLQGNTSAPGTVSVTIDTTAPAAPAAVLDPTSDSGNLGDSKTSDTTPTLSGTGTPGDTITVKDAAGNVIASATVAGDGTWTATPTAALPEGLNALSVTATDPAGNTSLPTALPVTIDTTVVAPVINPSNGAGAVTGTGEPGATVTLMDGSTVLGTAVVDASGSWNIPLTTPLANGTALSAAQTDLAGNASTPSTSTVDTTMPNIAPTNGTVISGTGTPGDTIALTLPDGTVLRDASGAPLTAVVDINGNWTATPGAPVPDGTTLVATDTTTHKTDTQVVDAAPPTAPVASLAVASDTGTVGDGITQDTTPTLSGGGASPGDTIKLYAPDGTTLLGTAVVAADGTWSITVPTALTDGTYNFQLTATDPAGNTSAPTTLPVTIDTSAPAPPVAALAAASDSGTLGDSTTSDNTPTLTGTGTPGDTITVKDAAGYVIATAVVDASGNWSATPAAALPDGLNTLSVTATDPAGNTSPATALPLTIDTTAPAAPAAVLATVSDSGTLGDSKTNDTTPTISGTGTPGDTITVKDPAGNVIATATVAGDGTWTATPTTALPEGLNTLAITATDAAGNTGPATALPITIDTTGPAAPAAALASVSDSGKLGDITTTDTTPTLSGTGMPGDTITVKNAAGTVIATATVGTDGTWTATPTTALPEGVNALSITATDAAGNTGAATALPITIDTTAPAAPVAALALVSDTGTVGDSTTTDNTPTLSGTGMPGDTITIKDAAGNVIATAVVAANGSWTATTSTLPDGVNALSVTATDPAGNTSPATALPITVDTSIGAVSISASNGIGAITGTGEPGATLTLVNSATGVPVGTVTVAPDGTWSIPLTAALPDGTVLSATQTDAAGNTSSPDTETINTAIPVLEPTNGDALTGTGKPGDTIAITVNGAAVLDGSGNPLTAVVAPDGTWTAVPGTSIPDGTTVVATDTASGLTDTTVVDAAPPAVPVGDVAAASDTGSSNTDNLTSDNTPTITGSGATPGDTIKLYAPDGTTLLGTAVVDAYGNWAITPTTPLIDGVQALKLSATDPLGNTSAQSTVTVTIDTSAPAAPGAALTSGSDSGTLGDNTTNDTTPTVQGTGQPGATITIKDAAGNVIATAVVDGSGNWSATTTALPEGTNALSITATDAAGNISPATPLTLTIDTLAPAQPATPDLVATSDSGTSSTDNLTSDSTPSLAVTAPPAGGSVVLYVDGVAVAATYDAATGTVTPNVALTDGAHAITYAVVDAAGNASPTSAALTVTIDTTLPVTPAAPDLTAATDSGSSATDNNTGDNTPDLNIGVVPAGATPVLYVDGVAVPATATTDSNGNTILTPTAPLTDGAHSITTALVDAAGNTSTQSTALSVTIDTQAPAAPGGVLALASDTGTVGDSTTSDATPTITGTGGTPGDTVTLKDATGAVIATGVVSGDGSWSVTPTASLANGLQNLSITATDPAGNTSPASTLPITIVNSPTTFGGDTALAITESNVAQTVSGTLTFSDPDGPTTLTAQTNVNGSATDASGNAIGKFTVGANGAWSYTMNSAQDQLKAGQVVTDTLTVSAADGSTQVLTVTLTGTNDQPYTVNTDFFTTLEDAPAPVNGVTQGTLVSSLYMADSTWRDAEGTIAGIAFVGPKTAIGATPQGTAWYSIDNGATWLNLGTAIANASLSNAFLLDKNARLYYQGALNGTGTREGTLARLWDGTDMASSAAIAAASGTSKDISTLTGANGAYSAANTTFTFHVTGVNDAPVNTVPTSISTGVNAAKAITGLQISDVDAGSTIMTVTLSVTHGTLTLLSGSGVTATSSGTASVTLSGTRSNLNTLLAAAGAVTYTPATGYVGNDTLTMSTNDNFVATQWDTGTAQTDVDTVLITVSVPSGLTATLATASNSGLTTDTVTNDNTPTLTGQGNAGETVTIYAANGTTVLGTVVVPTSGTWSYTLAALADGTQNVIVKGSGSANTVTLALTIDTTNAITITSVAGDAVGSSGNGLFNATERGFDTTAYTLNSTVTTPPVISGTTTADNNSTVTVTLNGKSYTTTVASGAWTITVPDADAKLLNHGNTYAIAASVSDLAGNLATDTNNGMLVNIALPDVPTVVNQATSSTTPTITGTAQKLNGAAGIALAAGDTLTVVIKNNGGTALTNGTYTLTVGGTSSPTGLSYDPATSTWSLAAPASLGLVPGTYSIDVTSTANTVSRTDLSASELKIVGPISITSIPEVASGSLLNSVEAANGTPVNINLANTGAVAGNAIQVVWDGQIVTVVLTAADIAAGTVAVTVPASVLQAATSSGTSETLTVSASLLVSDGGGVISNAANTTAAVNFTSPTAPVISATAWSATNTYLQSNDSGIPENKYNIDWTSTTIPITGTADGAIYPSEAAANGSVVRVQLPTTAGAGLVPAVANDQVSLSWGGLGTVTVTLTATNITAKYVDVLVPWSIISQQAYDSTLNVSATIVSAATGNPSLAAVVPVTLRFDVALAAADAGTTNFVIYGESGSDHSAWSVAGVGDVNGDGLDDLLIGAPDAVSSTTPTTHEGRAYVVFGNTSYTSGHVPIELSAIAAGVGGFAINSQSASASAQGLGWSVSGVGDLNGDGLADVLVGARYATSPGFSINGVDWVVYGKTSTTQVNLSAVNAGSGGFALYGQFSAGRSGYALSGAGDVNGDGYTDLLLTAYQNNRAYVMFGGSSNTSFNMAALSAPGKGFYIDGDAGTATGWAVSAAGDVNGDGLADLLVGAPTASPGGRTSAGQAYVVFGKTDNNTVSLSSLTAGTSSAGFVFNGQGVSDFAGYSVSGLGDVNGDGLADVIVGAPKVTSLGTNSVGNGVGRTYVVFGKTDSSAVNLSALSSGTNSLGFLINGQNSGGNFGLSVADAGDFNGDGLADMIVGEPMAVVMGVVNVGKTYLIYGKTSGTVVNVSNFAQSDGFVITGTSNGLSGYDVSNAGDINGDGFNDLLIAAQNGTPSSTRGSAGKTYVIFGGIAGAATKAIDFMGTVGDDALNAAGTSSNLNEQFIGGAGNDTLVGGGGADVMYGGIGNDTFVLNTDNLAQLASATGNNAQDIARVSGGHGIDTLQISATGLTLDVGSLRNGAVSGIERLDLNSASNVLKMNLADVMSLAGSDINGTTPVLDDSNNIFNTTNGWTATSSGGATGWGAINRAQQLLVDGDASNVLRLSGTWDILGTVQNTSGTVYKVVANSLNNVQVLVNSNVQLCLAPRLDMTANELPGGLNYTEATSNGDTPLKISLASTGALVGNTLQVNWNGQLVNYNLTSTDISNGFASVPVPTSTLTAATPVGTATAVSTTVTLLDGANALTQSGVQSIATNFIIPTAPTINATAWAATGAGNTSTLSGIPEAYYDKQTATYAAGTVVDQHLYYSEAVASANSGTVMRVQLPTTGTNPPLAGDTLAVTWGTQTLTAYTLLAADITAKYVDVVVPFTAINSQPFGTVAVTAAVTGATSGNSSPAATVNVMWAYDLPLADLTALSGGFVINGAIGTEKIGYSSLPTGAVNVGDVNGDGYDDVMISEQGTKRYVVYGRPGLATLELSSMSVAGNTNGFILTGGDPTSTRAGDINGDGLSDIVVQVGNSAYVVYGYTASIGQVALTALAASAGFKITYGDKTTNNSSLASPSVVGDVNGDGFDDILFNFADASGSGNFLLYGGSGLSNLTLPAGVSGTASNGFFITPANTSTLSGGQVATMSGDFNGDGYSDFALFGYSSATALTSYVYFGGPNLTGVNATSLNTAGNGRGFAISGLTGGNTAFFGTNAGDINGDGMEDIIFNDGSARAFVLFGKTNTSPVNVSTLAAGSGGFIINAGNSTVTSAGYLYDVDAIGDFNGDGLADMVVADHTLAINGATTGGAYVVFGRTATSALTLNNLAASEGFRIDGAGAGGAAGYTSTAAGDVNGDGFADVLIMSYTETPSGGSRTQAGVGRIVFGGVSRINDMVFETINGDAIGTTGADILAGSSGNNQLVAGDGNDTLSGSGGADVLYGGRGDDTIMINADNVAKMSLSGTAQAIARVDGGSGIDTLKLDGTGIFLDLSLVSGPVINDIEKIDLTGTGNNTLKLSLADMLQSFDNSNVFNSSNTTSGLSATVTKNQLLVDGDTGDKVVLSDLVNWTASGTNVVSNGHTYVVYNHNASAHQLLIDNQLLVSAT